MTRMDNDGNIFTTRGDTFKLSLINIKENGVLINWTGWQAQLQVRENPNSVNTVIAFSDLDGIDLTIPGKLVVVKAAADMNKIAKGYFYDLQMIRPTGEVETWFRAKHFYVEQDVAR